MYIKAITSVIDGRNELRGQAGLPILDQAAELNRLLAIRAEQGFDAWMRTPLRFRVEGKMLETERRRRSDPTWKPTGILSGGGLAFHSALRHRIKNLLRRNSYPLSCRSSTSAH